MFKQSRKKIVAAIMAILVTVWVGLLGGIYLSSYLEMSRQNEEMLKTHAEKYKLPSEQQEKPAHSNDNRKPEGKSKDSQKSRLALYYSVALSSEGEVLDIKNDSQMVYTDDELEALARQILSGTEDYGTEGNLCFYRAGKNGYWLIVFMDNSIVNESAVTLLRNTLIFGGVALALFFLLSVFLARKIVAPLEESYQKQKQFISDAGHELKTPVTVVSANAELLAREIGENQWLANIQYENERMGILVGQLLDLARTESVTPQMEHIDFSRLVAGEALPFESVAFERGLVLNSEITGGICVEGNSTQLKQIVSILLDNAIRHSHGEGEVRLSLRKEHGFAKLSVINRGDEIPRQQREQLFQRFYRVDAARNGGDKHYGLGLAIAKAITTAHKGRIEVFCHDGLVEFLVQIPAVKTK